ncbi:MAG: nitrous oxide reductase accessory protein NosL [Bacteroidia bacterium]
MKKSTRIVTLIISLALIITFFVPMWYIDLEAPQYPEGLGMQIWLSEIKGDLETINNLNHYIGMKTIHPEAMTEFKLMPIFIGLISFIGLITFFVNRRWLFTSWAVFFLIIGLVGLYDFYLWEYDYGHNLDPRAAIKVPGMSYQPPLIGSKILLNFVAHSYPHIGGSIIMGGAVLAFLFILLEWNIFLKKREQIMQNIEHKIHYLFNQKHAATFLLFILLSFSCSVEPKPISYGSDQCALCKMTISDSRYGSELLTKKGKAYKFDSIECLIHYLNGEVEEQHVHSVLITDYSSPEKLIDAKNAHYIISENMPSPMGANLTGFADEKIVKEYQEKNTGDVLTWEEASKRILGN